MVPVSGVAFQRRSRLSSQPSSDSWSKLAARQPRFRWATRTPLVGEHAILGPSGACRERPAVYREAGLQLAVLFPDPTSLDETITQLAGS